MSTTQIDAGHTSSGLVLSAGDDLLVSGTAIGTIVNSGGLEDVYGTASGSQVSSGGTELVESSGTAAGTTVSRGGIEIVSSGSTASDTTIENGGYLVVLPGGTVNGTIRQPGGAVVSTGVVIYQRQAGVEVYTTVASGASLGDGWTEYVLPGGVASNTRLSGASQYVESGGTAAGTTVSSGGVLHVNGCMAIDTTVDSGGFLYVNGGSAIGTTVNTGGVEIDNGSTPCFVAGTRIMTNQGEVPVERLREGDLVLIHGVGESLLPVRWIGHRRIDIATHKRPTVAWPIRLRRDAVAPGQPHRDLLVSPDHAVFLDGMLVPARLLVNGMTILQDRTFNQVDYFHVELDRYAILISDGLLTESYLDTGNRAMFENAVLALVPNHEISVTATMQSRNGDAGAPFAVATAEVEPVRCRLAARAEAMGFTPPPPIETISDPDLRLVIGERVIRPIAGAQGRRFVFMVPPGARSVLLCSRAASPADTDPFREDRRRLGVAVRRLRMHRANGFREIALDAPTLVRGWWAVERTPGVLWRWTDGAAQIPLPGDAMMLEFELHGTLRYPVRSPIQRKAA